jgi:hypothetical protein
MDILPDKLDENTVAIYLEIPGSQIVELQAYFELYEEIGIVRTLSVRKSLVCVLTTNEMMKDCIELLHSLRDNNGSENIRWRAAPRPDEETRALYHGYSKKGKEI